MGAFNSKRTASYEAYSMKPSRVQIRFRMISSQRTSRLWTSES
jgi:hypothetical protein